MLKSPIVLANSYNVQMIYPARLGLSIVLIKISNPLSLWTNYAFSAKPIRWASNARERVIIGLHIFSLVARA